MNSCLPESCKLVNSKNIKERSFLGQCKKIRYARGVVLINTAWKKLVPRAPLISLAPLAEPRLTSPHVTTDSARPSEIIFAEISSRAQLAVRKLPR